MTQSMPWFCFLFLSFSPLHLADSVGRGFTKALPPPSRPQTNASDALVHWDPKLTPYPTVRRDLNAYDNFQSKKNGTVKVPGPYNWLERPWEDSQETKKFISSQQAFAQDYLAKYPHRDELRAAVTKIWDYARFTIPSLEHDGYYYFSFNTGLQPRGVIYRIKEGQEKEAIKNAGPKEPGGQLFLDPNLLSQDGTATLESRVFSYSGKYVAYMVSLSGSDFQTIYVRRSDSPHLRSAQDGGKRGEDPGRMSDIVTNVKFSDIAWLKDDSGFFYSRYPDKANDNSSGKSVQADTRHMVYFHKLSDPQSKDILIATAPDNSSSIFRVETTDDGKYLVMSIFMGAENLNKLWIADLTTEHLSSNIKWRKIVDDFNSAYSFLTNDGSRLYLKTDKGAPNYKIVTYDLNKPTEGFKDLVPEDPQAVLSWCSPTNVNFLIIVYSRDANDEMYLHELKSGKRIKRINLESLGTIQDFSGYREQNEFFFYFSTFVNPGTVYRYRFDGPKGQELTIFRKVQLNGVDSNDLVSKQVFFNSKDGTRVPMFITHSKDFKPDGTAPVLQYGYGGFASTTSPFFTPEFVSFVKIYKGVLAVPNIRGGGEYGVKWHLAGTREHKQNVFDDFQYATKYLLANKYAAPDKVTIIGGSNGGLLVAACVNQAPELYAAAIPQVGVLDMLKFPRFTIGRAWIPEFGDPMNPEDFDYLIKYSPLHNINAGARYPALLVMTADHDDRVVPSHSFKFTAAVQHALPNNPKPLILRVEVNAGHMNSGKTTNKNIDSNVDELSFIAASLGLPWNV